jgi:hypothetical protein
MRKRNGVTIYEKEKGKGYYGDFRKLGGKLEALIPKGERRAATDPLTADVLKGERIKELENARRQGLVSTARSQETTLGAFAAYHLKQKKDNNEATEWTLGGVQRSLERAIEFFCNDGKPLPPNVAGTRS